jgi:hypothetical protein
MAKLLKMRAQIADISGKILSCAYGDFEQQISLRVCHRH